jgi:DNA-binding transcriptional MerR regulator
MITPLPVADSARLLGIHPKTLHHWLAQANVPLVAHPTDARIKCVTEDHLQQVARLHGRPLDAIAAPLVPSQDIVRPLQTNKVQPTEVGCLLPFPSAPEADLIQKLSCLETKIVTLQEQLAQLALALLQERERSVEHRITALETTIAELGKQPTLPPSLPNSQATGVGPERVYALHAPHQLHPAEQDTRSRLPALIEYSARGTYVIISSQQGELHLAPDSAEWFAWFATISSFRFVGKLGRFTAYRHSRSSRSWRAHRVIHQRSYKQTLGVTDHLTIQRLEQVAAALQPDMASL